MRKSFNTLVTWAKLLAAPTTVIFLVLAVVELSFDIREWERSSRIIAAILFGAWWFFLLIAEAAADMYNDEE